MMFCPNCGTQLKDGAVYCPNCGAAMGSTGHSSDNSAGAPVNTGSSVDNESTVRVPSTHTSAPTPAPGTGSNAGAAYPNYAANANPAGNQNPYAYNGYNGPVPAPVPAAAPAPAPRPLTEQDLPSQYRPLGAWAYFGYSLLFTIPLIGFIFLIVFSVDSNNINRRNYARSHWCALIISIVVMVLFILLFPGFLDNFERALNRLY